MKIAIVCFNIKFQAGGTRLIYELARGLQNLEHTVVIYAPEYNPQAFSELRTGLDIRIVPPPAPFLWNEKIDGLVAKIRAKLSQERLHTEMGRLIASKMDGDFDVVNVHDFAYKVAPFYKKRNPSARIIWTENDPPYMYLPKRNFAYDRLSYVFNIIKDIRERRYYRSIDRVAVLDGYNETWARTRGLAPVIVRSGVDFDNFYHPAHIRSEARAPFVLFSLGALNPYRRFEDLIEATALLRARGLQATARIICKDIWGEGAYRKLLEEQVARLGAQTYVSLNFDGASNGELKEAFNTSDAFVLTTHLPPPRNGYGWGLTNFEAMAAGLPLVICRTSTATEVLTDQKHAVIVEPRNPIDLADKIASLMSDPAHYNQIASAGQSYVRDNISWQKYASDMLELIQA